MLQSKLIQMLLQLDKTEWKKLGWLVESPYFNRRDKCVEVFQLLKETILNERYQNLEKKCLINQLFKNIEGADGYLRVIMRHLTQLVEEFFIQESLQTQPFYRTHLLHNVFLDKKLFQYYNSSRRKQLKNIQNLEQQQLLRRDKIDYFDTFLQAYDEIKYLQIIQDRNTETALLELAVERLDQYYWLYRLSIMTEFLTLKKVSKQDDRPSTLQKLPDITHLFSSDSHQLLSIYYTAALMINDADHAEYYLQLEQQLKEQHAKISKTELNKFYTMLINHLIRKSHHGEQKFQKIFELYQLMAQNDILVAEKYISLSKFKNVVTLGCILKQFDWTSQFIENYKFKLSPQHRDSIYAFNRGFLHFFQKEYQLAQEHLLEVKNFDVFYTMDTKSLLIQIYYETGQLQAVQYMLNPFRDFLRKQKKLNKNIKKSYLNFIKMLTLILKTQQKYGAKKMSEDKLLAKLDDYKVIHRRAWLREKIVILPK